MLKLRSPSPSSSGVSRGLAAISPQTETGMRMRSAASVANWTSRSTAGMQRVVEVRDVGRRRGRRPACTSSRSLVPIAKKSASSASASADSAAPGRFDHDAERRQRRRAARSPRRRRRRADPLVDLARRAHLGDRRSPSAAAPAPGPAPAARRMAASWVSNSSGCAQQQADAAQAERRVGVGDLRHDAARSAAPRSPSRRPSRAPGWSPDRRPSPRRPRGRTRTARPRRAASRGS